MNSYARINSTPVSRPIGVRLFLHIDESDRGRAFKSALANASSSREVMNKHC